MKAFYPLLVIAALAAALMLGFTACDSNYGYEFENGYNVPSTTDTGGITVDTSMFRVDRSMYHRARVFPGLVDPAEPRLQDISVKLNMNYKLTGPLLRINVEPQPLFSTGLYAPAGELITIEVPSGASGLSVQVGIHTDDLSNLASLRRDPVIYTVASLRPGTNYVRNLYGGGIYIRSRRPIETVTELKISGAVKSPDFILGETSDAEFMEKVRNSSVPWLELRGERVIFTLSRAKFLSYPLDNPTALMEEWDQVFDKDFNEWMGLSDVDTIALRHQKPDLPWRIIQDIQPSAGYAHSGYPVVALDDFNWFREFTTLESIKDGGNWGAFHEIGHNLQQVNMWSWSGMGETTNNLFAFKVAERNGLTMPRHPALDDAFTAALEFAASTDGAKDFNDNEDPFFKILPFVQLFEQYGYGLMPYLYTEARDAERYSFNDLDKTDFLYRCVSEYTKTDFAPFFNAWGIQISPQMRENMAARFPPLTKDAWNYDPRTGTGGDNSIVVELLRTTWVIADFSSEEASGEGPVNGRAAVVLDGDASTFWHSQWSGTQASPPHHITIDMGKEEFISGAWFIQRGSRNVKDLEILVSSDNATWQSMGEFVLEDNTDKQYFNFPQAVQARYLKVVMKSSWDGSQFAAMAEIGAYSGEYQE